MKLYLSVDMEGISGIPDYTYIDSAKHNYERGRRIMTEETNYVIDSAFRFGCQQVLVNDSHSKMNNILIDELHPDAVLITGDVKPMSMMQGLDETYDGVILLGYHARAGSAGVLSHSMIHAVRNFYLNDEVIGEMGFNAYVAGHFGVPVLMVAGDDMVAKEAEELIPGVTTAAVKETISRSSVKSLTPKMAGELLYSKTTEALTNRQSVSPMIAPDRPVLKIEFNNYGQAEWASLMPGTELLPGTTTVSFQAKDVLEAYRGMLVMTELAMHTAFS